MYTLCWSAKGGSGTTVVSCALALLSARHEPTIVVDLGGDVAAALGVAVPTGPGVGDWLAAPQSSADALFRLGSECSAGLRLVPPGPPANGDPALVAERLAEACARHAGPVVIDAGPQVPPEVLHRCASRSLVVVRPCYLGLRRATAHLGLACGVIVVGEPGRALGVTDVERTLGVPVVAELTWDPAVARAVDAGLLASRLPPSLARPLGRLCRPDTAAGAGSAA